MTKFAVTVLFAAFAQAALADESFTFLCVANGLNSKGDISTVKIAEDGASYEGQWLDADAVGAFDHQSIENSMNRYVNGKEANVMIAKVKTADKKQGYDGYPNPKVPQRVVSDVYWVELSVRWNGEPEQSFYGHCFQKYTGD